MKAKGVAVGLMVVGLFLLGPVGPGPAVAATHGEPAPPEGMVLIPAGSFMMGDTFGDGTPDELPVHEVYVSAFYMDVYEVTKALWDEVAAWATAHGYDIRTADAFGKARDHPVVDLSWYEAVKWANARSEKEGLTPCYYTDASFRTVYRSGRVDVRNEWVNWGTNGYRLPTEAEWEKAARGGCEGRRFPWCDADIIDHTRANYKSSAIYGYDASLMLGYHPAYETRSWPFTSPVGSFAPNGYGLYDMAGNVYEWCWDWWDIHGLGYESWPDRDPRGQFSGSTNRVVRGGSWLFDARLCRVASRFHFWPNLESYVLGFRLVRTAP